MKSDIEIAREVNLKKIKDIAEGIGIQRNDVQNYGKYMAKIPLKLIDEEAIKKHNLILVTAITPTKAGIGKTTVSIGLTLGLNKIGKKAIVALREPSLGPCFGMKGGAAGGGYSQVLPMENINLHFTGDFHAVTSAHNMITALLDNYIYQTRHSCDGLKEIKWKRVLDVNDRSLRNIVSGLGGPANGIPTETSFDITPASEIMAILCLASDIDDLKRRVGDILLGYTNDDRPFTVNDLGVAGAITVLLKDALLPNLVQTTENTAAFVHGGPFANIAHGCNSVVATKMALTYADYVITEAGFGADLGAEKFFNIKCRKAGLTPKLTVIVATSQSLKLHGGVPESRIKEPAKEGLISGLANLDKHIDNMKGFGQQVIVTFNRFDTDTDEEINLVAEHCKARGVGFAVNSVFAEGGEGGMELAQLVVDTIENTPSTAPLKYTYEDEDSIREKIRKVAESIYGASSIVYTSLSEKKLKQIEALGISHYPVCIAKTQYSFSSDPKAYGVAKNFELKVRDVIINNGAEMIVAVMGEIMRMPGLPKEPQAKHIDIVNGQVEGLS
ncbi:formate--tetrahydrofolate ligase [Parabacteroides sp. PF5-5]|uniref:formate--tetrahydrofolate ligase n=1 Tax=unclassified Parabacteroides TaxID=2649774 RepID=UPI0024736D72|nr:MULTISPECIES: formate--tetrahydrofolate ligase [unclassified Parabacteroides]MDH6304394.1 formate--tetrahydrofolate ligase [Parabacteroides sp. PH5-39]MDH6315453.1 formate--tetrahydrofolate ligase [Parabacteroides sp. PF5-13]MDH6319053.1 formate--tetrahydrofolate ligase [Parabacteroides sp. PH5-13]MDH6322783.1 formate--tetrahydrofolate ligase [Parabacteroides sp. PH5-8]MDH6326645.1 formate--tetrahydrofolate ligase [Parabacteroides sp. PH5-41]